MSARRKLLGVAAGVVAIVIWAGWIVWTGWRVSNSSIRFTPLDIGLLRSAPAALLLAPFWLAPALRNDVSARLRDRLAACWKPPQTPWFVLILMMGWGAPFLLCSGYGLSASSSTLMAALVPGAAPLFAALLGALAFGARPPRAARPGIALVAAAALLALWAAPAEHRAAAPWFVAAATGWAGYILGFPRSGLAPLRAVGLTAAWATLLLLLSAPFLPSNLSQIATGPILFEATLQGGAAGALSIIAYTFALNNAPPLLASGMPAAVPVIAGLLSALAGAPPTALQSAGLCLAGIGLALLARARR